MMTDTYSSPMELVRYSLDTYGDDILRIAYTYMKNKEDAEDIVQDTLMKLMLTDITFHDESHHKAWLLRVAINLCKDRLKAASRKNLPIDDGMGVENYYLMPERDMDVINAVLSLPEKYRIAIHLFYYEELSTMEIAKITGQKESTVRSLLRRGRKKLYEVLTDADRRMI